jgi:uncharacterized protein
MSRVGVEDRLSEKHRIILVLQAHLPELRERYGVRSLGLFGSYLHGRQHKTSDVDLLVEFDRVPSLFRFLELEQHLSEILGKRVDLVMRDSLKPAIGGRILQEVVEI